MGLLISTGHALTELLMVGALALGMGQALRYPLLVASIGILGGLFLLWMGGSLGWGALRREFKLPQPGESAGFRANRSLIGLGIATTVSNSFLVSVVDRRGRRVRAGDVGGWADGPVRLLLGPHRC